MNTETNRIEQLKATIDSLEQQLAKQAEIIEVLMDCVVTTSTHEVGETAAKQSARFTLKKVEQIEAKYKGKE